MGEARRRAAAHGLDRVADLYPHVPNPSPTVVASPRGRRLAHLSLYEAVAIVVSHAMAPRSSP